MPALVSFCSVFSIRLGSIIVGAFSLMQGLAMELACYDGLTYVDSLAQWLNEFMEDKDFLFTTPLLNTFKNDPGYYLTIAMICIGCYCLSCVLVIYGAYEAAPAPLQYTQVSIPAIKGNVAISVDTKVNSSGMYEWILVPYLLLEFVRILLLGATVVSSMLILKKNSLDLGSLMGGSIGGGFMLLLLGYLWACPLSLFQVLRDRTRTETPGPVQKNPMEEKMWQQMQKQQGMRRNVDIGSVGLVTTTRGPYNNYPRFHVPGYPSYRQDGIGVIYID